MRRMLAFLALVAVAPAGVALAQQSTAVSPARMEAAIKASWPNVPAEWQARLVPDETLQACSAHHNNPPAAIATAIQQRERARIEYPADGKLMGDWKKGEAIAQNGYGLRFTDYPVTRANGGNCYACHQLDPKELSYGTVAPSLLGYGKSRKFAESEIRATYDRIYNSQAILPCSNMPRFGSNKVLTIDQIKDLVALLMSPDSPVNK